MSDYDDDPLRLYLREMAAIPPLSAKEEAALVRKLRTAEWEIERAHKRLMQASFSIVVEIAHTYEGPGSRLLDLIQDGNQGLYQATTSFEARKEIRFAEHAVPFIHEAIRQGILRRSHFDTVN